MVRRKITNIGDYRCLSVDLTRTFLISSRSSSTRYPDPEGTDAPIVPPADNDEDASMAPLGIQFQCQCWFVFHNSKFLPNTYNYFWNNIIFAIIRHLSRILICEELMCFVHYIISDPWPSTAPYQTYWLCVLFTTFFLEPWIHGPVSNILIMCVVYYLLFWSMNPQPHIKHLDYVFCLLHFLSMNTLPCIKHIDYVFCLLHFFSSMNPHTRYQISWLCVLFTTFFYPWMHRPEPNTLIMCFAYYMFWFMNPRPRYQIYWLCVLFTTFFDPWIHGPQI